MKHATFPGRLVIVGFGAIGQGLLPLIIKHLEVEPAKITVVTAEERGHGVAREYGVRFVLKRLTRDNYKEVLAPMLREGDFLVNVSVDVSSLSLVELCQEKGAF